MYVTTILPIQAQHIWKHLSIGEEEKGADQEVRSTAPITAKLGKRKDLAEEGKDIDLFQDLEVVAAAAIATTAPGENDLSGNCQARLRHHQHYTPNIRAHVLEPLLLFFFLGTSE